jgi:MOSC domain-containing protein YiiM
LNCFVIRGGEIRVGDHVELARHHECETVRAS